MLPTQLVMLKYATRLPRTPIVCGSFAVQALIMVVYPILGEKLGANAEALSFWIAIGALPVCG